MGSGLIVFFELSLVLGVALVFGLRELRNLRRFDRERAARAAQEAAKGRAAPAMPVKTGPPDLP